MTTTAITTMTAAIMPMIAPVLSPPSVAGTAAVVALVSAAFSVFVVFAGSVVTFRFEGFGGTKTVERFFVLKKLQCHGTVEPEVIALKLLLLVLDTEKVENLKNLFLFSGDVTFNIGIVNTD